MSSPTSGPCAALLALVLLPLGACQSYGLVSFDTAPPPIDSAPPSPGPLGGQLPGEAPVIESFSASEVDGRVRFSFTAEDMDLLRGGALSLRAGASTETYLSPEQAAHTEAGVAFVVWPLDAFELERSVGCELVLTDRHERVSEPATTSFTRFATPTWVPEVGDTLNDVYGLGLIELPAVVEGDLYGGGNDGSDYTADVDILRFRLEQGGAVRLTLTWDDTSADADMFLMEAGPNTLSSANGSTHPEILSHSIAGQTDYYVAIAAWRGRPGGWTLRIER